MAQSSMPELAVFLELSRGVKNIHFRLSVLHVGLDLAWRASCCLHVLMGRPVNFSLKDGSQIRNALCGIDFQHFFPVAVSSASDPDV